MSDNSGKKPLRSSSNMIKDIYNTYIKNDDKKEKAMEAELELSQEELEQKVEAKLKNAFSEESHEQDEQELNQQEAEVNEFDALNAKIKQLEDENYALKDQMVRSVAELENMKRRTQKEKLEMIEYANKSLLTKLLEIPDNMQIAIDTGNKSRDFDSMMTGFDLIYKKLVKIMEEQNVKLIEINPGDTFDVNYHEALMQSPHDSISEGHIIQVVQNGYIMGEKVLRHAKVITSSGNA